MMQRWRQSFAEQVPGWLGPVQQTLAAQDSGSPSDCRLCMSEILLPSDELIHIVHCDGLRGLSLCPFEKDAYISGLMQSSTGARLPPSPVLLETINLLFGKHLSPP
jgi:hypothetical protein